MALQSVTVTVVSRGSRGRLGQVPGVSYPSPLPAPTPAFAAQLTRSLPVAQRDAILTFFGKPHAPAEILAAHKRFADLAWHTRLALERKTAEASQRSKDLAGLDWRNIAIGLTGLIPAGIFFAPVSLSLLAPLVVAPLARPWVDAIVFSLPEPSWPPSRAP